MNKDFKDIISIVWIISIIIIFFIVLAFYFYSQTQSPLDTEDDVNTKEFTKVFYVVEETDGSNWGDSSTCWNIYFEATSQFTAIYKYTSINGIVVSKEYFEGYLDVIDKCDDVGTTWRESDEPLRATAEPVSIGKEKPKLVIKSGPFIWGSEIDSCKKESKQEPVKIDEDEELYIDPYGTVIWEAWTTEPEHKFYIEPEPKPEEDVEIPLNQFQNCDTTRVGVSSRCYEPDLTCVKDSYNCDEGYELKKIVNRVKHCLKIEDGIEHWEYRSDFPLWCECWSDESCADKKPQSQAEEIEENTFRIINTSDSELGYCPFSCAESVLEVGYGPNCLEWESEKIGCDCKYTCLRRESDV